MAMFPAFMKQPVNRIASASQHTQGAVGYVFDGADGSQVAFWECSAEARTEEHVHEFDEYFVVVEGSYSLILNGEARIVGPGQECYISRGTRIAGYVAPGTRTIHFSVEGEPSGQRTDVG